MSEEYLKAAAKVLNSLNHVAKLIDQNKDYSEHYFRGQLLRYFQSLTILNSELGAGSVLDIGNYPSHLHKALLLMNYEADGVDIDPDRIPKSLSDCRTRTFKADIESYGWDFKKNKYDIVVFLEVIEHLHVNPFVVFSEIDSILKKGGHIFISTPNLFSLKNRIRFMLGRYVFEHPFSVYEKLERHGSRGHQRIYSIDEIADILDVFGFDIVSLSCENSNSPLIEKDMISKYLDDDFSYDTFKMFWSCSFSKKGKIRINMEKLLNKKFPNFSDTMFIIAQKNRSFDKNKIIEKIKKADPWVSLEKFKLK